MNTKPKLLIKNDDCIENIKCMGIIWVDKVLKSDLTYTKPGSISHLLYLLKQLIHFCFLIYTF